jgi:hypothetical protein
VVWLRTKQMHRFQIASYEQTHVEISLFRLHFLHRDKERESDIQNRTAFVNEDLDCRQQSSLKIQEIYIFCVLEKK